METEVTTDPPSKKSSVFHNSHGEISNMRVMAGVALAMSVCMSLAMIYLDRDYSTVIGLFLGAAFTGKASQTFGEKRPRHTTRGK